VIVASVTAPQAVHAPRGLNLGARATFGISEPRAAVDGMPSDKLAIGPKGRK
jgi:hypothetical protein